MTIRRKRLLLRTTAGTLVLAAVGACAAHWWPVSLRPNVISTEPPPASSASAGLVTSSRSLAVDEAVWKRILRKPLFDPPLPPSPEIVKVELPPIRARLLGTILEPGNSQAMIELASGSVEFRTVGQSLGADDGDAQIIEISASAVKVKRGEELSTLSVEASGQ